MSNLHDVEAVKRILEERIESATQDADFLTLKGPLKAAEIKELVRQMREKLRGQGRR